MVLRALSLASLFALCESSCSGNSCRTTGESSVLLQRKKRGEALQLARQVLQTEVANHCDDGKVWTDCVCQGDCANPEPSCDSCQPGCACPSERPLLVDGQCVNECPPELTPLETLAQIKSKHLQEPECADDMIPTDCVCQGTCAHPEPYCGDCQRGCQCAPDKLMHEGRCVSECPPELTPEETLAQVAGHCPAGQSWVDCACQRSCTNPEPDCHECHPGCQCDPDTLFHEGECVTECPPETADEETLLQRAGNRVQVSEAAVLIQKEKVQVVCEDDMIYTECACARTCFNPSPDCSECKPGCQCPPDTLQHNGACVTECPPEATPEEELVQQALLQLEGSTLKEISVDHSAEPEVQGHTEGTV